MDPFIDSCLPDQMHGFRNNKGTESALVSLLDQIKELKSRNQKVVVLALDCSCAFDLLDHNLVASSLELIGSGPKMVAWSKSFLENCFYSVSVGSSCSTKWSSDVGAGQGRRFSPIFFNVGSITMPLWDLVVNNVIFADDCCSIVHGSTMEELNRKIESAVKIREEWYRFAGFSINGKKSELMGVGCTPDVIMVDGCLVVPKNEIKFLGLIISSDLSWKSHTKSLCDKIRFSAGRIRTEGRFFSMKDKKLLFNGWIRGLVHSNGLAYLPFVNKNELKDIQVAMNSGIRAMFGLRRFGNDPIGDLRKDLKIPTILEIKKYVVHKAAWASRDKFLSYESRGPTTRSRSKMNLPLPDEKGWRGKMVSTILFKAWNELSCVVKSCNIEEKVKYLLKREIFTFA